LLVADGYIATTYYASELQTSGARQHEATRVPVLEAAKVAADYGGCITTAYYDKKRRGAVLARTRQRAGHGSGLDTATDWTVWRTGLGNGLS